ncbi:MAG: sulfur carrier protein ThiS [Pirellulales bacterium]|nr:sulfur carrier protein ThiS [Pirellulales bacterium]
MTIQLNGADRQIAADATVADLLAELGLDPRHVAVERNLELAPRTAHADVRLAPGDRIEIVTLVGGG